MLPVYCKIILTVKLRNKTPRPGYKKILIPTGIALLLVAGFSGVLKFHDIFSSGSDQSQLTNQNDGQEQDGQAQQQENPSTETKQEAETAENPSGNNSSDPALSEAGNDIWVVNKTRPLDPKSYQPNDLVFPSVALRVPGNESMKLRAEPAAAVEQLFNVAKGAGHSPLFSSGYRSYNYQVNLYNGYVKSMGQTEADKQSARPGYSEHQTGLAFDICTAGNCKLEQAFGTTPFGQWIKDNAHKYGFIIRYPDGKQNITGYMYEPWHLRYVGTDVSAKIYSSGQTMEEYFGLPAAPDYN